MGKATDLTDEVRTEAGTMRASGEHLKPLDREASADLIARVEAAGFSKMNLRRVKLARGRTLELTLIRGKSIDARFDLSFAKRRLAFGAKGVGVHVAVKR